MNKVEFIFDGDPHYALYNVTHLDGSKEYYLELRDRALISEFGLEILFHRQADGTLRPGDADNNRKKNLLETILHSIDRESVN